MEGLTIHLRPPPSRSDWRSIAGIAGGGLGAIIGGGLLFSVTPLALLSAGAGGAAGYFGATAVRPVPLPQHHSRRIFNLLPPSATGGSLFAPFLDRPRFPLSATGGG